MRTTNKPVLGHMNNIMIRSLLNRMLVRRAIIGNSHTNPIIID